MKTITVREAQHNLARVLHEVEAGEVVEILRRKTPVARIIPIPAPAQAGNSPDWKGHAGEMTSIWGDKVVADLDSILDDLRGER